MKYICDYYSQKKLKLTHMRHPWRQWKEEQDNLASKSKDLHRRIIIPMISHIGILSSNLMEKVGINQYATTEPESAYYISINIKKIQVI